jgi:hypothetical protein
MTYPQTYYIVRMDDEGNWIPLQGFDYNPWYASAKQYAEYEEAQEMWCNKYPHAWIDGTEGYELNANN